MKSVALVPLVFVSLALTIPAIAAGGEDTGPTVTVRSPKDGSSGQSPVPFHASATSPSCSKGIAAIRIYTAPGVSAYNIKSDQLDAFIPLVPGTYSTVVQAWDNCGQVGKTALNITVAPETGPHHYLYVAEGTGISGWKINTTTGAISPTGQGLVLAHTDPYRAAADQVGAHLYVANVTSNDISAYTIDRSNGYLSESPGSPYSVGMTATAVAVHPSGNFVYVTRDNDAAGDGVAVFSVNPDGSLATVPGSPFATQINPVSLLVDSSGKYLYAADSAFDGYIDAFSINPVTGGLTPLTGSPFLVTPVVGCAASFPSDIAEDVAGQHLYASDSFDNAISGYSIATDTGALTEVPGSPFPNYPCTDPMVAFNPDTLTVTPSGKFLYAANGVAQTISSYSVDHKSGTLTFLHETPQCFNGVYIGPILRSDPSNPLLYTMGVSTKNCGGSQAIVGFTVDPTSGSLTAVRGSPTVDWNPPGAVSGAIVIVP